MTFSIAARCPETGMLGAAVTTSGPCVGARCLHVRAGVGVVLTQFWTDPRLGPRGLSLLAEGLAGPDVVAAVAASTPDRDWRQLAALDAMGGAGFFHGAKVKGALGAATGAGCIAIGNILASAEIPAAMAAAFAASRAPFPERLLTALEAGEAAGGEGRPLVSAALLVMDRAPFAFMDLRIDASATPLADLRALHGLYAAQADTYAGRAMHPREMPQQNLLSTT